ncbi:MAG: hypothetical protein NTZ09_09355 [Candidatus Hydrogenedentes bacterium]|nr:hypothetical protein [Candidatus Hydrogenedentota bacterium]
MRKNCICIITILVVLATGQIAYASDNATYDPPSNVVAGIKPFSDAYTLGIISPGSLNKDGDEALPGGIVVNVRINATSWPAGSSQADAEAMVSVSPVSLTYTALNETQNTDVSIAVGAGAVVGDYTYTIQGVPPTGLGWGLGAHNLTISVGETGTGDTTPPIVTIVEPADGAAIVYCLGGTPVDIEFQAVDPESAITSVAATVNGAGVTLDATGLGTNNVTATGVFIAGGIGAYTVVASATSQGGTGDATADFTVNYVMGWLPPLSLGKTSKGGSDVPIKFTARDCSNLFVHDETVTVVVYEVTAGGDVACLSGVFGEGASFIRIDDAAGQYIINFKTAAGAHNYRADVLFNGFFQASKQFSVR